VQGEVSSDCPGVEPRRGRPFKHNRARHGAPSGRAAREALPAPTAALPRERHRDARRRGHDRPILGRIARENGTIQAPPDGGGEARLSGFVVRERPACVGCVRSGATRRGHRAHEEAADIGDVATGARDARPCAASAARSQPGEGLNGPNEGLHGPNEGLHGPSEGLYGPNEGLYGPNRNPGQRNEDPVGPTDSALEPDEDSREPNESALRPHDAEARPRLRDRLPDDGRRLPNEATGGSSLHCGLRNDTKVARSDAQIRPPYRLVPRHDS
jgi:hypothetical protein